MSIINYTVFNPATNAPELADGFVQLTINRASKEKGIAGRSVQVPEISESVLALVFNTEKGKKFFAAALDTVRAGICKKIVDAGGLITSDKIGIDGILANIESFTAGNRLTKEAIAEWFGRVMAPILVAKIEAKYPGISNEKKDKILAPYLAGYQECAARESNRSLPTQTRDNCLLQLAAIPDDSDGANWVACRIAEILPTIGEQKAEVEAL
jgi:hypothetical protein